MNKKQLNDAVKAFLASKIIIAGVVNWEQWNTFSGCTICVLQSEASEKLLWSLILGFFFIPRRAVERWPSSYIRHRNFFADSSLG